MIQRLFNLAKELGLKVTAVQHNESPAYTIGGIEHPTDDFVWLKFASPMLFSVGIHEHERISSKSVTNLRYKTQMIELMRARFKAALFDAEKLFEHRVEGTLKFVSEQENKI